MKIEKLLSILKYSILCFFIVTIFILIKAFTYKELGIEKISFGEGWFSLYEYKNGNPNFIISFGDFIIILSLSLGCILQFIMRYIKMFIRKR